MLHAGLDLSRKKVEEDPLRSPRLMLSRSLIPEDRREPR